MTLRYDSHRRPRGLDWTVCNDGTNRPEIWSNWRQPKPRKAKHPDTQNLGSGRGQHQRTAASIEEAVVKRYTEDQESAFSIARYFEITPKTVYRILERNGIPARTMSQAMTLSHAKRSA